MSASDFWSAGSAALHKDVDQRKRQQSASAITIGEDYVDRESGLARIKDYAVSLDTCTCVDFTRRALPCKHMYRLAHELGRFDLGALTAVRFANRDAIKAAISDLSESARDILDSYLYCLIYDHLDAGSFTVLSTDKDGQELLASGLMDRTESDKAIGLRKPACERLVAALDAQGIGYTRQWNGKRRQDIVLDESATVSLVGLRLADDLDEHKRAMYLHTCSLRPNTLCPNCGKETPRSNVICLHCGAWTDEQ